ncbi:MAG: TolC family protein [Planctomycetaceae bacterium]|nr:TolC family protein [Planctomycetaceae bacterium]
MDAAQQDAAQQDAAQQDAAQRATARQQARPASGTTLCCAARLGGQMWERGIACPGLLTILLLLLSGCRFGTHRLDCDTPHELEYTVITEPPLPNYRPASHLVPEAPADLSEQRPDYGKQYLTITEAIAIALHNNPSIKVNNLQGHETAQGIDVEDSVFDPQLDLGAGWTETESQILNTVDGPGPGVTASSTDVFGPPSGASDQIIFSKKTRTGGEFRTNFGTTYSFVEPDGLFLTENPAVRTTLSVHGSHPLFQGAGRNINAVGIRIARQVSHSTTLQSRVLINKTIVDTATAYWQLYGAIAELTSQEKGLAEARETWEKEKRKLELGESSKTQIAESREQYERFRANRALIRKEVADAERSLRLIMAMAQEDGTRIVPTTIPQTEEPYFDWEDGYRTAFQVRPELRVQKAFVNMARLQLQRASDGRRPNVNAYAGYSISGAGGNFSDSLEVLQNREFGGWWAGFSVQHQFGQRRSKAILRQAELGLARELQSMKAVENSILSDLHEAYQAVTNAWHVLQLQKDRQEAAETILEARRAMYDVGEISLEVYLRGISGASISASEERAAIARYNQALIRWEFARGTIMEFSNVQFDSMDPEAEPEDGDDEGTSIFIRDYLNPDRARQDTGIERVETPKIQHEAIPLDDDLMLFDEGEEDSDLELLPMFEEVTQPGPDGKDSSQTERAPEEASSSENALPLIVPEDGDSSGHASPDTPHERRPDRETGAMSTSPPLLQEPADRTSGRAPSFSLSIPPGRSAQRRRVVTDDPFAAFPSIAELNQATRRPPSNPVRAPANSSRTSKRKAPMGEAAPPRISLQQRIEEIR